MSEDATAASPSLIVVGVDGSDAAKDALRWAAGQAEATGAVLQVVIAWDYPVAGIGPIPLAGGVDFDEDARTVLNSTIAETLGEHPAIPITRLVVEGAPALALLEASRVADLLVVGSRGHGAFVGMLLGSVSEHCVAHARCPVVVVRHAHRPEPG